MDLATKLYAECITTATADAAVNNDAAGAIADRVMLVCKDKRKTLMADVIAFHQIGHPKFSIEQSKAVAEASIATIEDELRRETVVSIISRQMAGNAAGDPSAAAPLPPAGGAIAPATAAAAAAAADTAAPPAMNKGTQ
jgi:hypothetical protein